MGQLVHAVKQPPLLIAGAMAMWVATELAAARTFGPEAPYAKIVWLRYAFHLLLMAVCLGLPRQFDFVRTQRPWLQLFRSFLMLLMPMSFALAALTGRGRDVFGVFWSAPLMVLAMSAAAGDRPSRAVWITTLVGWLGIIAIYRPSMASLGLATLPALVMGLSFSGYVVLTRVLDRTESLMTNLFYSAISVFVLLTIALPWFWSPVTARELVGGAVVAVCGWVVLCLLDMAMRGDSPARLAPFLYVQTIVEVGLRPFRVLQDPWLLTGLAVTGIAVLVAFSRSRTSAE